MIKEQVILERAIQREEAENAFYYLLEEGESIQKAGEIAGAIPERFILIGGKRGPMTKEKSSV